MACTRKAIALPGRHPARRARFKPEVRERLVGVGHAMQFLSLTSCAAAAFGPLQQFARQANASIFAGFWRLGSQRMGAPCAHRPHFNRH